MKLDNGTPKYSRLQIQLICVAGLCPLLSCFIGQTGRAWIVGIGSLSLVGVLVTILIGAIGERKECKTAHDIDASK